MVRRLEPGHWQIQGKGQPKRRNLPRPRLEPHDPETGEILSASEAPDPIANLILAIRECQTREELETHRAAVAALKNGQKKRAIDAWKAVDATFPKAD